MTAAELSRSLFRAMDEACDRVKAGTGTQADYIKAWHAWAMSTGVDNCTSHDCAVCNPQTADDV